MPRSYNGEFLRDSDGRIYGINLGSDACFEHESEGIGGLKKTLGISDKPITNGLFGIKGRQATIPARIGFWKFCWTIVFGWGKKGTVAKLPGTEIVCTTVGEKGVFLLAKNASRWNLNNLEAGYREWDLNHFLIVTGGDKEQEFLADLFWAFWNRDVAIWQEGGYVFRAPGLVVAIASMIPAEVEQQLANKDKEIAAKIAART